MEINNIQVCNVCLRSSEESQGAIFIKAMKNGEEYHINKLYSSYCIHGSGDVAKSSAQVAAELNR